MRTRPARHGVVRFGAALSLAALLVLGGCGDGGTETTTDSDTPEQTTTSDEDAGGADEASSEVPDLCTLLSAEDFESVAGAPSAGEPEATPATGAARGMCTWSAETGFPMVMVGAYNASDREATLEMVDAEPVEGLATEADWAAETGVLMVVEGQDWYLQVFTAGTDDDKAASIAAAEIVLANL